MIKNNVNKDRLAYWITYPEEIEAAEITQLEEVCVKYPYFQLAYMLLVNAKVRHEATDLIEVVSKASVYALNRSVVRRAVENDLNWKTTSDIEKDIINQTADTEAEKLTIIKNSSAEFPGNMENSTLIQKEPTQEGTIKSEAEKREDTLAFKNLQKQIVEKFIKNDPKIRPVNDFLTDSKEHSDLSLQIHQPLNSDSLATESFAIILEKQGKFSKSKEIYEKLSLKNPEKKNYFAEKIKELSDKLKD